MSGEPNPRLLEQSKKHFVDALYGLYSSLMFAGPLRSEHVKSMFAQGLVKIVESECDTFKTREEFLNHIFDEALESLREKPERE